ncbi:hypothetical protein NC652_005986 [Populus alba x Populus x berolinensis]|nr:hypothetical protein NC652_005986 [Populus alba x Populus x berolinensis]
MPFKPDKTIWSSMLGACGTHRNTGLVSTIAENLLANCPNDPSIYVMLSNAYGTLGMWDSLSQSRKERKETAIEGPKKGRNGIEFLTGLACLNLLHYLEHC